MHAPQLAAVLVASWTWAGFASTMRTYFRHADRRTPAKTLLILAAFVCTLIQLAAIARARPHGAAWLWLGLAGYAAANGLFWWALAAHGKSHPAFAFVPVPPSRLTTAGPYRLVRHPIHAAYLLAWCAGAAAGGRPWLLAPAAGMAVFYASAARRAEHSFLASPWAAAYAQYRRRTGMFLPKLTGLLSRS
jgi:protein-S-isoprenylcysteine O-methyltransferase Ste14